MAEKFTPEEVARLDPFGVRQISASEKLRGLLEANQPEAPKLKEFEADLIEVEKGAWQKVLGRDVHVSSLPAEITPEIKQELEREGFSLVFLPALDLYPIQLKTKGVTQYLKDLGRKYPNWQPFEDLTGAEKNNHRVVRNLEGWFWERVKQDEIDFPSSPGDWIAVENLPKPDYGKKYQETAFGRRLDFTDRFNVSWDDAQEAANKVRPRFFSDMGLKRGEIRFLNVLEWNLLANREGWGKTNSYEWTNTKYRGSGSSGRLIVGYSDYGGAADVHWLHPSDAYDDGGFRFAVVFGP